MLRLASYLHFFKRKIWRIKFLLDASGNLSQIEVGKGIRFDVPVRVGAGKGGLEIGDYVGFGWPAAPRLGGGTVLLEPRSLEATIKIGAGTMFSNNVSIISMGSVTIGKRCLIGDLTTMMDCDFHGIDPECRIISVGPIEPISIANNVWIGSRVQILRGVSIGENSVIGASSVVTHDIPANSIAAGVPAKKLRSL